MDIGVSIGVEFIKLVSNVPSTAIFSNDGTFLESSDNTIPVTSTTPDTQITNPTLFAQFMNWVTVKIPSWFNKLFN